MFHDIFITCVTCVANVVTFLIEFINKIRVPGGKSVLGKRITQYIIELLESKNIDPNDVIYIEPFTGGAGVLRHMNQHVRKSYANDINKDVIMLLKEVRDGTFKNPHITRSKWLKLKDSPSSAVRAFAGHGCSFGGVWFRGFIDSKENNDMEYSSLVRMAPNIQDVIFHSCDYRVFLKKVLSINHHKRPIVIYLDPPYANTNQESWERFGAFDSKEFWNVVRKYSKMRNVTVIVSEFTAPSDFKAYKTFQRRNGMHNHSEKKYYNEKLFIPR